MSRKNLFTTEVGIFCSKCGKPIKYYSFRTNGLKQNINGYHCANEECDNTAIIEDGMNIAEIVDYGFEAKETVVFW